MAVCSEPELVMEIERLRAELAGREREAADKELQLERYAADLREIFKQERARSQELQRSYMATVRALSNAVEARDAYTRKHAERVTAYGMEIARAMGLPLASAPEIEFGFLLHDIGKVAIPDAILYKPSALTDKERALMAQHPLIGAEIVRGIEFLGEAAKVVRSHHERWDGRGYPDGLAGEEIPLAARVFAVADVLDALTTDRPYRPASPLLLARRMIVAQAGKQFDPRVVEAFSSIDDQTYERIGTEIRTARDPATSRGVLVVDDDPFIRKLIAKTLDDVAGFELHEAADGLDAIEVARRERPTLVFLDIDMPALDGIDVCRRLREDPATRDTTIVMLTATDGDSLERRAEEAGADLFLTKPFSPLNLLRLVDRLSEHGSP
jgi:putative nucleotidyltransferase with HDIG domain